MPPGPRLRELFGPLEILIANAYRSLFVDLREFVRAVRDWAPASRILEVGCGEGSLAEQLAIAYPEATITGLDITPRVGRLFRGDRRCVTFWQQTVADYAAANPASQDLVLICDVLHHVPWEAHERLLRDALAAVRVGGRVVVKDWERRTSLAHLLCYCSDRYITGDRIRYASAAELRALVESVFGPTSIEQALRIPPRPNNVAFMIKPEASPP